MPLATPEELARYPPPPLPDWIKTMELLKRPEDQITFLNPDTKNGNKGDPFWISNYGPQTWALLTPFDETCIGGARGGAKSACLIAWFAMGDKHLSPDDPARYSYLLEPSYRGLILRKEYQAMAEFVDEAEEFYRPLGGVRKDDPAIFTFKSGAKIYTNHLGDEAAFEKYRGHGITRIGIEELTQIEHLRSYLKLLGSLRSKRQIRKHGTKIFPALRAQIMATTNPDGPGRVWVTKRFVKVPNEQGSLIERNTPMKSPSGLVRIFIPMSRKDNPYLRDSKQYDSMIAEQDEVIRRQWEGDWDVGTGTFFRDFRPHGPVGSERTTHPWARHVIAGVPLKFWHHRWGSGDIGYDHPAAFHKFCRDEKDGRIHCYDELKLRQVGAFDLGVRVAEWWLPELEKLPDKSITLAFSHDAFNKTDSGPTKADQFSNGIKRILGPYGAFILKYSDDERIAMEKDPQVAAQMFNRRRSMQQQGVMQITVTPASRNRQDGLSFMRDLLRFRKTVHETEEELKRRLMETFSRAQRDQDTSAAVVAYEAELAKIKRPVDEALPKLQIWNCCTGLIRCMEDAMQDEKDPNDVAKMDAVDGLGGNDELDSARMGCKHFKEVETLMPKSYYVSERMEQIQAQYESTVGERIDDPNRLIQIRVTQEAMYDKTHVRGRSFTPVRASSGRHRVHNRNT